MSLLNKFIVKETLFMTRKLIVIVFIICLFPSIKSFAFVDKQYFDQAKKTVVFLGRINDEGEPSFCGTACLLNIKSVFHLITAKHVIMEFKNSKFTGKLIDDNMYVFFNTNNGKIEKILINDVKKTINANWIFHENNDVDLAVLPFMFNPEKDDIKCIPENSFVEPSRIYELYDVFFLAYQPGLNYKKKISPAVRNGIISIINDDKTFYIDASAFPGNSGSPVFLTPSPIRFDSGDIVVGNDELGGKFIGIIGEYLTYQDVAISLQTDRPRIVFEENTGLSKVWSITYLKQIIDSKNFKQQLDRLTNRK